MKVQPIEAGQVYGRWTLVAPLADRPGWWRARCPCGGEADLPRHTIRARTRKCPSCLGSGKTNSTPVEPDPDSPLATPADLAREWVLSSVVASPKLWVPWGTYKERQYVASAGQCGIVIGKTAACFPFKLRAAGIDTTSLKGRALIGIGKRGVRVVNLATRPVQIGLPPDEWFAWSVAWPGASTSLEDKPEPKPQGRRYDEVPAKVAAYLRTTGGNALPNDIATTLQLSKGAVMNSRRADFLTSRRILGGKNSLRFYLLDPDFPEPPELAPREKKSALK